MNIELEKMWEEAVMNNLKYITGICLKGLRKKQSQGNWSSGQYLHQDLPKCEVGLLTTWLWCSVLLIEEEGNVAFILLVFWTVCYVSMLHYITNHAPGIMSFFVHILLTCCMCFYCLVTSVTDNNILKDTCINNGLYEDPANCRNYYWCQVNTCSI